jgi:hypothetical protein
MQHKVPCEEIVHDPEYKPDTDYKASQEGKRLLHRVKVEVVVGPLGRHRNFHAKKFVLAFFQQRVARGELFDSRERDRLCAPISVNRRSLDKRVNLGVVVAVHQEVV